MEFDTILKEIIDENGNIPADNVGKLVESFKDFNKGLAENKNKILAEKKQLENKIKLYEDIDPDEVKKLKEEYEKLTEKVNLNDNDAEKIKKMLTEKYNKEIEAERQLRMEIEKKYTSKIINEKLSEELDRIGIKKPTYKKAVSKLFENDIKVIDSNILVGDKDITDFINEWSQSDEAKDFIDVEMTVGGGVKKTGTPTMDYTGSKKDALNILKTQGKEAYLKIAKKD